ncbi:MAG TPA: Hint domain-containing protein [Acidisoma sp.]|uniref:Hint domain-containing protein n=1 Tax=Acidisoma sp. TaxID=1872115 RepID=UPI002C1560DC|nr:Hint domain-containing protein [Acidisoma sp.]HTI00055.1 Hint domain-containing protein [Acidisoma sp.]
MASDIVSSGMTLSGATIASGTTYDVLSGGTLESSTIASGGSVIIEIGAADSGTTIQAGGMETLSGSAAGDAVYGTQLISASGAIATGETIYNGGSIDLFLKGGVVADTTILSGGTLAISGNAITSDTTINAGGVIELESPKAQLQGSVVFNGAGEIVFTDVSSAGYGELGVISGFAAGAAIDEQAIGTGATLSTNYTSGVTTATITSGATTETLFFSGNVTSLGLIADGTGGVELVYGSGGTSIPTSGTVVTVASGATSVGAVIGSGVTYEVASGGRIQSATIEAGGTAIVNGTDLDSTILSGGFELLSGRAQGDSVYGVQELSASAAAVTDETIHAGGIVELFLKGATAEGMTIDGNGSLVISGNAVAEDIVISNGGLVDLQSPKAELEGGITFAGGGTIALDAVLSAGYGDLGTISGFQTGGVIDDRVIGTGATLSATFADGVTTATITSGSTEQSFTFAGDLTSGLALTPDQTSGTALVYVPCFAEGTRIETARGAVAVESLAPGDEALTQDGRSLSVTWIGHRRVDLARHPVPEAVQPVRISPHAFGQNMPARPVLLSPDHAVYAEGVLIPVKHLVNGSSVRQIALSEVTYFHVELTEHAVILADGLPAESYLSGADRTGFANGGATMTLHPTWGREAADGTLLQDAMGAAPLRVTGPEVEQVRLLLAERAMLAQAG